MVNSGKIVSICDVNTFALQCGDCLRTWGMVTSHDLGNGEVILSYNDAALTVDTKLVEPVGNILGRKVQAIGELEERDTGTVLVARLIIPSDSLDFQLFEKVLTLRQGHLRKVKEEK